MICVPCLWRVSCTRLCPEAQPRQQESPLLSFLLLGAIAVYPLLPCCDVHRSGAAPVPLAGVVSSKLKGSASGLPSDLQALKCVCVGGVPLKSWGWGDAILFVRGASGQRGAEGSPGSSGVNTGSLPPSCPLTGPEDHSFQRKAPSSPSPSNQWKVPGEGLHYHHGCLESRKKFPKLPALTLKSAPLKKVKRRKREQATFVSRLGAAWAWSYLHLRLRGPRGC